MTARFPALMSILRFALKNNDLVCQGPSNKFSREVLRMLRNNNYIAGFSKFNCELIKKNPHEKMYKGFPKVIIFLRRSEAHSNSIVLIPRLYPRTQTNFKNISFRRLKKIANMKQNFLISTSAGLIFSNNYLMAKSYEPIGGILILKVIVR